MSGFADRPVQREKLPAHAYWLPVVLVALTIGAAAAVHLAIRDELPAQIASHWGTGDRPDGFTSFTGQVVAATVIPAVLAAVLMGVGFLSGIWRQMALFAVGMAGWLCTDFALTAWRQRGLTDASAVSGNNPDMLLGIPVGALLALLCWLVIRRRGPRPLATEAPPADIPLLAAGGGDLVAWTGRMNVDVTMKAISVIAMLPVVVMVVFTVLDGMWWLALTLGLIGILLGAMLALPFATVGIGRRGVEVRLLGVRCHRCPLETIEGAETDGNFFGAFTGWGIRAGNGSVGFITASSGEALRIHRAGTGDLVLTVKDAGTAAAALNTLVARGRG